MIGPETQEIFETLIPEDDTYEKALKALDEQFSVKKNVPFERSVFHQARQKSGESIEQFVTRLRKLAATCEYGDTTNEQIRDQVIATCTSSKLRKRLLSETDLTSDKVLQIGKIMESAHHHNKEIETKAGSKSKDDYQVGEEYLNYLKWKNRRLIKNRLEVKNNRDKVLNYVEGVEPKVTPVRIADAAKMQRVVSAARLDISRKCVTLKW